MVALLLFSATYRVRRYNAFLACYYLCKSGCFFRCPTILLCVSGDQFLLFVFLYIFFRFVILIVGLLYHISFSSTIRCQILSSHMHFTFKACLCVCVVFHRYNAPANIMENGMRTLCISCIWMISKAYKTERKSARTKNAKKNASKNERIVPAQQIAMSSHLWWLKVNFCSA